MANIVLLGPPGAGKGTQTENIIHNYNLTPIVPGYLMREHIRQDTLIGRLVVNYVNEGLLAPHEVVMDLIEEQVKERKNGCKFLFDGFPRAIDQATLLDKLLPKYGYQLDGVILLEVPDEIVKERIKDRAKILGRSDDQSDDKIAKRLEIYHKETSQVVTYYEKQNKLYRVKAVGTIKDVFGKIIEVIELLYRSPC